MAGVGRWLPALLWHPWLGRCLAGSGEALNSPEVGVKGAVSGLGLLVPPLPGLPPVVRLRQLSGRQWHVPRGLVRWHEGMRSPGLARGRILGGRHFPRNSLLVSLSPWPSPAGLEDTPWYVPTHPPAPFLKGIWICPCS